MTLDRDTRLKELVELSNWLGAPEQDCAILGEGNTSTWVSDTSFLVKASGTELGKIDRNGFVEIRFEHALGLLDDSSVTDDQVREALNAGKVDPTDARMPSVETSLHAICLSLDGVEYVGHTHPTAINAITCSNQFEIALKDRIFPDEVVVCGTIPLLVPYVDPGVELARVVKRHVDEFVDTHGEFPKTIYMQNHGFIALGSTTKQVMSITAMAVKSARIRLGTMAYGGWRSMSGAHVERIDSRPDEHYRQRVIKD